MFEPIAAIVIFALFVLAMSLGLIFRRRPLKASCGGLNNLKKLLGLTPCEGCTDSGPDCPLRKIKELEEHREKKATDS